MSKKSKVDAKSPGSPLLYDDHPKPVTRRQFLAQGLIGGSGVLIAPSALSLFFTEHMARAATGSCPLPKESGIGFFQIDLVGGLPLERYFVASRPTEGDPTSALLDNYAGHGWTPTGTNVDKTTLLYPMANDSTFYTALRNTAGTAINNAVAISFASDAVADVPNNNPFAVGHTIAALTGLNLLGSASSLSGMAAPPAFPNSLYKATQVTSAKTLDDLNKIASLPDGVVRRIFRAAENLSGSQQARLSRMDFGRELATLVGCGLKSSGESVGKGGLNPIADTAFGSNFNVTGATPVGSQSAILATLAMGVIKGSYVGASYTIGGCDIHTGNLAAERAKGTELGTALGQIIKAAVASNKKMLIFLSSDGSADGTPTAWTGDAQRALTVLIYVDPSRTHIAPNRYAFNGFDTSKNIADTSPGGVSDTSAISKSPARVAHAVAANYYYLMKLATSGSGNLDGFNAIISTTNLPNPENFIGFRTYG